MNRFIVMRHAAYDQDTKGITEIGFHQIQKAASLLNIYFLENEISEINIIYSPAARAENTAVDLVDRLNVKVNSLTPEPKFRIKASLSSILAKQDYLNGEKFTIIIGHQPDINSFLRLKEKTGIVGNCNCFLQNGEKLED